MSKMKQNTHGTARCAECLFGRGVTITDYNKAGKVTGKREMCECHVSRPTRYGFPVVRTDDFCACHVDAKTGERTFAGLAPVATVNA